MEDIKIKDKKRTDNWPGCWLIDDDVTWFCSDFTTTHQLFPAVREILLRLRS